MHSKIDVINLALANLANQNFIQDDSEPNSEAIQAGKHWDVILESVLAEYPWSFAMRETPLGLVEELSEGSAWRCHYAYPAACVMVRKVIRPESRSQGFPFQIGRSHDGLRRVVMTDALPATAEYTTNDIPVSQMPAMFVNALAWRLAAEIALAQRADPQLFSSCLQAYTVQADQARLQDARERGPVTKRLGQWLRSRHG